MLGLIPLFCFASMTTVQVSNEASNGLRTVGFATLEGRVEVRLPEDVSVGDTISGSVVLAPLGKSPDEVSRNTAVLEGYVLEIGDEKAPVGARGTFKVDSVEKNLAVRLISGIRRIGATTISTRTSTSGSTKYAALSIGQIGRPYPISGSFDGDSRSTLLRFGNLESQVVAESPRQCISIPMGPGGPIAVSLNEGPTTFAAKSWLIGVRLSAPRTQLMKGESTVLNVEVVGLTGLEKGAQVRIVNLAPTVMSLEGGDDQVIEVKPDTTRTDGVSTFAKRIDAIDTGAFRIDARVLLDVPVATVPPTPPGFKDDPTDPNLVVPDGSEVVPGDKIKPRRFPRRGADEDQVPNDEFDDRKWQSSGDPTKAEIGSDVFAWYQHIPVESYRKNGVLHRGAQFPVYFKWRNNRCVPGHWEQIVKSTVWVGASPTTLKKAKAVEVEGPPKRTEHLPAANDSEVAGKWAIDTNEAGRQAKDPRYPNQDKGEMIDSPNRARASMADAYSNENPKVVATCVKNLVEFYTFWIGPDGEICEILKWSFWVQWEIAAGDDPLRSSGMKNATVTGGCFGPARVDKGSAEGIAARESRDSALRDLKG